MSTWEAKVYKTELVPVLMAGPESAMSAAQRMKRNHQKGRRGTPRRGSSVYHGLEQGQCGWDLCRARHSWKGRRKGGRPRPGRAMAAPEEVLDFLV